MGEPNKSGGGGRVTKMLGNDPGIITRVTRVYWLDEHTNTVMEDFGANSAVIVTRGDGVGSIMSMFPRVSLIVQK